MAGPSFDFGQYPTADSNTPPPYLPTSTQQSLGWGELAPRTMDPSQAIPNTGINGGASGTPTTMPQSPGVNINPQTGQAQTSGDPQTFFNNLFPGNTLSPDMLAQHEAELNAQGIKIIRNAAGQPSKIQLPDGSVVDPIIGAGSGQNTKAWNVVAGPGGAPMGGGVNGSAGSVLGGMGYNFGSSMAPIGLFTPPTAEDALNSPGLQFALSEANRMGQNSAAAKGTLLNGRFQQALNASNIQNALQGYGDVYNRAANTYGINYQTQTGNQDRPFNKNLSLAELGKPA